MRHLRALSKQAELLAEREITHRQAYDQLKTLKKLTQSPYFGRFDFIENGEKEAEAIYVGVGSLMDQKDEEFLIYDWRAPISSLYYDYSPGKAQYETPGEAIKGEMKLKRQFIIENSVIKSMFDTGITIRDESASRSARTQCKQSNEKYCRNHSKRTKPNYSK